MPPRYDLLLPQTGQMQIPSRSVFNYVMEHRSKTLYSWNAPQLLNSYALVHRGHGIVEIWGAECRRDLYMRAKLFVHICASPNFFCFLLRARTPRALMNTSTLMELSFDVLVPPL